MARANISERHNTVFIRLYRLICDRLSTPLALDVHQGESDLFQRLIILVNLQEGETHGHILLGAVHENRCAAADIGNGCLKRTVGIFSIGFRCLDGNDHLIGLGVVDHVGIRSGRLADGILVLAFLIEAQSGEGDGTIGTILHFFHNLAGSILQNEGKLLIFQNSADQVLARLQMDPCLLAKLVSEGQALGFRLLAGNADGLSRNQLALVVHRDADVDMVHRSIINDGRIVSLLLGNIVHVITGAPVGDLREGELSVCVIGDGLQLGLVDICQDEGKFTTLKINSVALGIVQDLIAGDLDRHGANISIGKGQRTTTADAHRLLKDTGGLIVRDYDRYIVNRAVISHARTGTSLLVDLILVGARLIVGQLREGELSACVIADTLQLLAAGIRQHKGIRAVFQSRTGQILRTGQGNGNLSGGILVGEIEAVLGVSIVFFQSELIAAYLDRQVALVVVCNLDRNSIYRFIVGNAVQALRTLGNGIGVSAGLGIGDRSEGEHAASIEASVLHGLDDLALSVLQFKGKLTGQQVSAGQGLGTAQSQCDRFSLVGIAEGDNRASRILIIVVRNQSAVAAVGHFHNQVVHSAVVGDAAQAVVLLHHVIAVGADLREGHLGEGHDTLAGFVNGSDLAGCNSISSLAVLVDFKHKPVIFGQGSAGQNLICIQSQFGICGLIGVGEPDPFYRVTLCVGNGGSCGNIVGCSILCNDHGHMVLAAVISPASGNRIRGFLQNVVMGAHIRSVHGPGEACLADTVRDLGVNCLLVNNAPCAVFLDLRVVEFEHEALQASQGAAGFIHHSFEHIQIDGCGVVSIYELGFYGKGAVFVSFQRFLMGDNGSGEPAIHVPNGDGEGMQGSVVGDTVNSVLGNHFQNLECVFAGLGEGNTIQQILDSKGLIARLIIGVSDCCGLAINVNPLAAGIPLNLKGKVSRNGSLGGEGLSTCDVQIHGSGLGGILVHDDHCGISILGDGHSIISVCLGTGVVSGAIGHLEVGVGVQILNNGDLRVFGNTEDLKGIGVLQRHGELAIDNRYLGQGVVTGVLSVEFLICHTYHGDGQLEFLVQHLRGNCVAVCRGHFLGDIQVAVTLGGIDEIDRLHLTGHSSDCSSVGNITADGDGLHSVVGVAFFRDRVGRSCFQADDINGLVSGNDEGSFSVCKGQLLGHICAIGTLIGADQSCFTGAAGDHKGKCGGAVFHSLRQSLGNLNAGSGCNGQLTVVAQNRSSVVLCIGALFHDSVDHMIHGTGGVHALCSVTGAQQLVLGTLGDDPVTAILLRISQCVCGDLDHHTLGAVCLGVDIVLVIVCTVRIRRGFAGIGHAASFVGKDHRVGNVIVALVLLGCFKVGVGIDIAGLRCAPVIGVEDILAQMIIMSGDAAHNFLDVVIVEFFIQRHFKDQTDRAFCCADDSQGIQIAVIGIAVQLDLIFHSGDQRGGDCPSQRLISGGDLLADPHGGVHHIAGADAMLVVNFAHITVRLVDMSSACRNSHIDTLIPEAQEITVNIRVPANVVAERSGLGVESDLAVVICLLDQRLGGACIADAQTGLDGTDEFIAQLGGVLNAAALTGNDVLTEGLAGIEAVTQDHALDIGDIHVFADVVNKGNVAVQIMVAGFHQSGGIPGLENDLIHQSLESGRELIVGIGGEELIYVVQIVGFIDISILSRDIPSVGRITATTSLVGVDQVHLAIPLHGGPHSPHGLAGGRRIHNAKRFLPPGRFLTVGQGVEQGIGTVMLCHLVLCVSSSQLGHESNGIAHVLLGVIIAGVIEAQDTITQRSGNTVGRAGTAVTGKPVGAHGGLTVTHQHHKRHTDSTRLDLTLGDHRVSAQELLHGFVNAVLYEGTGVGIHAAGHCIAPAVSHTAGHFHTLIRMRPGTALSDSGSQVRAAGGGISIQRQQHLGDALVDSSPVTVDITGVQHHTHTVVVVQRQQLRDGLIGLIHQFVDSAAVVIVVTSHRTGQVQNEHRIRGNGGVTGDRLVGCHYRQGHQEVVHFFRVHGNIRSGIQCCIQIIQVMQTLQSCRDFSKDRLIRPDHTRVCGGQIVHIKELFPAVESRVICHPAIRRNSPGRNCATGDRRQHHHHCQQQRQYSLLPINFSHTRPSPKKANCAKLRNQTLPHFDDIYSILLYLHSCPFVNNFYTRKSALFTN